MEGLKLHQESFSSNYRWKAKEIHANYTSPSGRGNKNLHNEKISLSLSFLNWSTEALYYPLLVTAPVRKECCRDLKASTPGTPDPVLVIPTSCHHSDFQEKCYFGWRCRNRERSPQKSHSRFTTLLSWSLTNHCYSWDQNLGWVHLLMAWVSLIMDKEFIIDKKFGQFLLRQSIWYYRAAPSPPQFHPLDLLVHSFNLQVTPVQNKPHQQSCKDGKLWMWGIPLHTSPDPLKKSRPAVWQKTCSLSYCLLSLQCHRDYECPNQHFFPPPCFLSLKYFPLWI